MYNAGTFDFSNFAKIKVFLKDYQIVTPTALDLATKGKR